MLIIPAIDIYNNKIVRLKKGNFEDITYYKDSPLEMAEKFKDTGFKIIHIVDLMGSKAGDFKTLNLISRLSLGVALGT